MSTQPLLQRTAKKVSGAKLVSRVLVLTTASIVDLTSLHD
jgi:hypothetical protein